MAKDSGKKPGRIGFAPSVTLMPSSPIQANRVISVKLEEDEEVQWTWTYWPNGENSITGYTIVKKTPEETDKTSSSRRYQRKRRVKRSIALGQLICYPTNGSGN